MDKRRINDCHLGDKIVQTLFVQIKSEAEPSPVTGDIDIVKLLDDHKTSNQDYKKGEPIFMLGKDIKPYRK